MAAPTQDKSIQFISKLVQLTQERGLEWQPARAPSTAHGAAFTTAIDGRKLRIYKVERTILTFRGLLNTLSEPKERVELTPILEILDEYEQSTYSFENRTGLDDLYEAVSSSASKIADLMESVLQK
jgi:hypothetical protein